MLSLCALMSCVRCMGCWRGSEVHRHSLLVNCAHRRGNEAIKVNNTADAKRMYERGLKVTCFML
jgi:hypothetical protein